MAKRQIEAETEVIAPGVEVESAPVAHDARLPAPSVEDERPPLWDRVREEPFLRLILYYVLLVAIGSLLVVYVPVVRRAFVAPVVLPAVSEGAALLTGETTATGLGVAETVTYAQILDRSLITLLVIIGALLLVLPVARVYMTTKRLRYDPSLVRSVVILPIVVAGIALVVKNSLALAFSLAGIVAAVRFRNTLKDPRDAVYIFLTIAIGLSAGVQALDVALVMSMLFNFVVLFLWRFNIGSIYGGRYGRTGILSAGDTGLLVAQQPSQRKKIRKSLLDDAEEIKTDGILLVHAREPELARHTVQESLSEMAKDWRLVRIVPRGDEISTLEYLVRLKKKTTAAELIGSLSERWSSQVTAAEYIPFRTRKIERTSPDKDEDGDDNE